MGKKPGIQKPEKPMNELVMKLRRAIDSDIDRLVGMQEKECRAAMVQIINLIVPQGHHEVLRLVADRADLLLRPVYLDFFVERGQLAVKCSHLIRVVIMTYLRTEAEEYFETVAPDARRRAQEVEA